MEKYICSKCSFIANNVDEIRVHVLNCFEEQSSCSNDSTSWRKWTRSMVLLLLAAYKQEKDKFNDINYTKQEVFNLIADTMKRGGYSHITGQMCDDKWRGLKKSYLKIKKNDRLSENSRFEYFQEMDEILGEKANTNPTDIFETDDTDPLYRVHIVKCSQDQFKRDNSNSNKWSRTMVIRLLAAYKQAMKKFSDVNCTRKQIFSFIADSMNNEGFSHITPDMCNDKWRGLKKTYLKIRNGDSTSGLGNRKFEFLPEMDDILGNEVNVAPLLTSESEDTSNLYTDSPSLTFDSSACSLVVLKQETPETPTTSQEVCEQLHRDISSEKEEDCSFVQEIPVHKTALKKRLGLKSRFPPWYKDYVKRAERFEEARKRRHQERMEKQSEIINLLKELAKVEKNKS